MEEKKKHLPPGVEQMGLKQYKELHKRELEKRNKEKKASKAVDKIAQIVMTILALPLLGIILYWGYCLLMPKQ